MRSTLAAAALLMTFVAAPHGALAQTVGAAPPDRITVDEARDVAAMNGVTEVRKLEFYDGAWHAEGRDDTGRRVEMTIDPRDGRVTWLDRFD
jgi:Peptidase propeptide and YPEB domain